MDKILYINCVPLLHINSGGQRVIVNYLTQVSKKHDVHLITTKGSKVLEKKFSRVTIYDILNTNSFLKFLNPISFFSILTVCIRLKPSYIVIELPWFGMYAYLLSRLFGISYELREQNIEFTRFRTLKKWWWPVLYLYEYLICKKASAIYCISQTDKQRAISSFHIPTEKVHYTPYVVDTAVFKPNKMTRNKIRKLLGIETEPVILFFGSVDYQPNREAVEVIRKQIAPLVFKKYPQAKFLLVGKNPPKNITNPNIIITGFVEHMEDYINASDIVIVPLLSGGGIRIKILEALSCGKAVISTFVGAEGIIPTAQQNLVISPINKFASEINKRISL